MEDVFTHDIHAIGVHFDTPSKGVETPTARSFILVTPDAERTMQTFLGACVELGPDDTDPSSCEIRIDREGKVILVHPSQESKNGLPIA